MQPLDKEFLEGFGLREVEVDSEIPTIFREEVPFFFTAEEQNLNGDDGRRVFNNCLNTKTYLMDLKSQISIEVKGNFGEIAKVRKKGQAIWRKIC